MIRSYYLGPDHPAKIRLIRTALNLTGARLKVRYAGDRWISLDLSDGVQEQILQTGAYEPEVWEALARHARANEIVWDVGANIGGVSLMASANPAVREVVSFEPHPVTYGILRANIGLNENVHVKALALGLGEQIEERDIFDGPADNSGATTLSAEKASGAARFKVRLHTVDGVIAEGLAPAPTLMKIDVEGWELGVLRGGKKLFSERPPRALVIEAPSDTRGNLASVEIRDFLVGHGYQIEHINRPDGRVDAVENYCCRFALARE